MERKFPICNRVRNVGLKSVKRLIKFRICALLSFIPKKSEEIISGMCNNYKRNYRSYLLITVFCLYKLRVRQTGLDIRDSKAK